MVTVVRDCQGLAAELSSVVRLVLVWTHSAIAPGWWWWLPGDDISPPQTELACLNPRRPTPTTVRQKISVSDTPSLWKLFKVALTDGYCKVLSCGVRTATSLACTEHGFTYHTQHCLKPKEALAVTKRVHVYKVFLSYLYLFVCLLLVRVHTCHGAHRVRRQLSGVGVCLPLSSQGVSCFCCCTAFWRPAGPQASGRLSCLACLSCCGDHR